MVVARLSPDGKIKVRSSSAVDLVVDVQGYFSDPDPGAEGAVLHPLVQTRLKDTRGGSSGPAPCAPSPCGRLVPGTGSTPITLGVTGVGGVPASGVQAVVLTVTAVNTSSAGEGYLRVWPADVSAPSTSSLNYGPSQTRANTVTTRVSDDGEIKISAAGTATDVIVDVAGWYSAATGEWTYTYDGDGTRASKTSPDELETSYTWDHSTGIPLLLTEHTGATRTYVIYGPGGTPYAQVAGTDIVYYHRDQLGSTVALTDADGDPIATFAYDPYGTLAASTGTITPLLGYAGEYTDDETGLIYLRARYYDPETGQFTTRDPLEQLTSQPYAYANNNPLTYTDPFGLFCIAGTNPNGSCRGSGAVETVVQAAPRAWDYAYEVVTDSIDDAWDFTWRNRGTIATVGAVGTCLVPAIGLAGCAYAAGGAFLARSSERIEKHGFRDSAGANLADGALTYLTLGLGGAFQTAGHNLSPGLSYLGRLVPAGYDATGAFMWVDELC